MSGDGGSIYLESDNEHISFVECEVSHNEASGLIEGASSLGGGIMLEINNNHISFTNSLFERNTAARGGAIGFYDSNTFALITSCMFRGNYAQINGGALYFIFDSTDTIIKESQFIQNSAEYGKY